MSTTDAEQNIPPNTWQGNSREPTKYGLLEQVRKYVADLQIEMEELINATPQTSEDRHQVFLLKKRIVNAVLAEARIDENREIHIKFPIV